MVIAVALLVAVQSSGSDMDRVAAQRQPVVEVQMAGNVAVGVVFPPADGSHVFVDPYRCSLRVVVQLYLCIVRRLLTGFGHVGPPLQGQLLAAQQLVLAQERGVGDTLLLPAQA